MAADIPPIEPEYFTSGETVQWTKSLADFPASEGWTLAYKIRGTNALDIIAVADGDDYDVTITKSQSATLTAGNYWWQSFVTKADDRHVVDWGEFEVRKDLAAEGAGYDGRTHATIVLDALQAMIQGKASRDQMQLMVGDRQISRLRPTELREWRAFYRQEYLREQRADRVRKGLGTDRRILARFGNASG